MGRALVVITAATLLGLAASPTSAASPCLNPGGDVLANDVLGQACPAGTCVDAERTADPRVFGPFAWRTIHTFARNYPNPPSQLAYEACVNFTYALAYMLPCGHCGRDFAEFVTTNAALSGKEDPRCAGAEGESVCLSVEEACKTRRTLNSFFVRAHNNVNNHTHPCRAPFTTDEAMAFYEYESNFCAQNIVWGTTPICRGPYCFLPNASDCVAEGTDLSGESYGKSCCSAYGGQLGC